MPALVLLSLMLASPPAMIPVETVRLLACAEIKKQGKDEDNRVVTLKGRISCAKCDLERQRTCRTVIKVKEGEKYVVYYFDWKSNHDYHLRICQKPTNGKVTGTIKEEGGRFIITASKVEFDN